MFMCYTCIYLFATVCHKTKRDRAWNPHVGGPHTGRCAFCGLRHKHHYITHYALLCAHTAHLRYGACDTQWAMDTRMGGDGT